jgi:hypothetical protein
MSKADQYRQYAVECWRRAWQEAKRREHWMTMAARWMMLAALAAKAEGRRDSASG